MKQIQFASLRMEWAFTGHERAETIMEKLKYEIDLRKISIQLMKN